MGFLVSLCEHLYVGDLVIPLISARISDEEKARLLEKYQGKTPAGIIRDIVDKDLNPFDEMEILEKAIKEWQIGHQ